MFYTTDVVMRILFRFNESITTASSSTAGEDKEIKVMSQLLTHSQNSAPKDCVHTEAMQQNSAGVSLIYRLKQA